MSDAPAASQGWWPASPAADLLRDAGAVVPVAGAGLSTAAGLPSSPELARRLSEAIGEAPGPKDSLFAAADRAYASNKIARPELNRMICDWLRLENHPQAGPIAAHRSLVRVPSRLIVTFNYDLLFERAAEDRGIEFRTLTHRDNAELGDHLRDADRSTLCIYHAHGTIGDPDSLVLDAESYRRIASDLGAASAMEFLAQLNSLCFIGTRLDEPYLQTILQRLLSNHPRHVLVCDERTAAEVADADVRGALLPTRYGIVTAAFPTGEWGCLDGFCERLVDQRRPRRISVSRQEGAPYSQYVDPPIMVRARDAHSEILSYLKLAFEDEEEIALPDVVRAGRAVVVGPAGCGKTSLLHRLGSLQPQLEPPVRIDLSAVKRFRGSPRELLRQWLSGGTTFREGEISPDSRAVLLLDGLDEVDFRRQEEAAAAIAGLAASFPQHRFIVASRIVPAVRALALAGFVEFELHPTRLFAERFLASFGFGIEELRRRLPAVAHLGALGSNPFVLTQLMRLVEEAPEDLTEVESFHWLMGEMIGAFAGREAERLAYSVETLRETAGALAAAMSLHGLRTLDVTTYPFETEAEIIAEHGLEEFVQEAARRLLVWTERSEFVFTEPTIEMYLAAERLLQLDPDGKRLLGAIAPKLEEKRGMDLGDGRRFEMTLSATGVREDLRGLAALLASLSPVWARRLFPAAPPLIARAVPVGATRPSPKERARALWEGIVESVEKGDRRRTLRQADLTGWLPSEARALSALIEERRMPALQDRVRNAAQRAGAPPLLRGRALEVLAGSGRLSARLLDRLAADDGVPVRSVAYAVRELQRPDLVGALIRRGEEGPDRVSDQVAEELVGLIAVPGVGERIVEAIEALDPAADPRYFWRLVGVVRLHGSEEEAVALLRMLVTRHREALREFGCAVPEAIGQMAIRVIESPKALKLLGAEQADELIEMVSGLDTTSEAAGRRREELVADPAEAARETRRGSTVSVSRTSRKASQPDPDKGVPVLMVRSELEYMLRGIAYGLAGQRGIDLLAGVPPEMLAESRERSAGAERVDPLLQFGEALAGLPDDPDWEQVERLLRPFRSEPFAARAAIGAQLEQRLPVLAQNAGTEERANLLKRFGGVFALRPSAGEWAATAAEVPAISNDWLKAIVPEPREIRELVGRAAPKEVPALLRAMPAEMRVQVVDEAAAVLASAGPRSETEELGVAQACADGAGSPEAIVRLTEALPAPSPLLGGWAAAAGDLSRASSAFEHVFAEIEAGRGAALVDRIHLGWVESVLGRLEPDSLMASDLLSAFVRATSVASKDRRGGPLVELLGVTACMVDPVRVAVVLEYVREGMGWTAFKGPFISLFEDARMAAHRATGSAVAATVLGVGLEELEGERAVLRFKG